MEPALCREAARSAQIARSPRAGAVRHELVEIERRLGYVSAMKRLPMLAAIAVFFIHLIANPHYGFFRDELYFIICGRHPQWGYVDQPPLVPLLAAATQIFGHSLVLLRTIPALFAAGGVYVTCLLALEFGGGVFAQGIAALLFVFTPVLTSFGMKVGTDEAGLLLWPLIALMTVRIARGASPKLWVPTGLAIGLCFESKYSIVFFVAALFIGIVVTPQRRILWNAWFAAGAAIAVVVALPNVLWQIHYGLPMLELLRNGQNGKNIIPSVPLYALQELLITNPLIALGWIVGLAWLFRKTRVRFLAYAYVALIVQMLVLHGKHYYPANIYPILLAAGGVQIEAWTARFLLSRVVVVAYAAIAGLTLVPDVLPIFPEQTYVAFAAQRERSLHASTKATETEHDRERSLLPGDWADMHGWPEMAAAVKAAYESLPASERRDAVAFGGNYGEASAIAFFAPSVPVISEHNQYWLWGTQGYSGKILIQVNGSCFKSDGLYGSRTRFTTLRNRFAISYEDNIPIWICRRPKKSLAALWPSIKNYE
jgi:hypothetical protein